VKQYVGMDASQKETATAPVRARSLSWRKEAGNATPLAGIGAGASLCGRRRHGIPERSARQPAGGPPGGRRDGTRTDITNANAAPATLPQEYRCRRDLPPEQTTAAYQPLG
jgi:hypothetical protein